MTERDQPQEAAIRIALQVPDQGVAERLTMLLSGVPGIILVDQGQDADAALIVPVRPRNAEERNDGDLLTTREH